MLQTDINQVPKESGSCSNRLPETIKSPKHLRPLLIKVDEPSLPCPKNFTYEMQILFLFNAGRSVFGMPKCAGAKGNS